MINNFILSGFTDEASSDILDQIRVTKELGWQYLSARTMGTANIHDIPESEFENVCELLKENNIQVAEFGTLIGTWAKSIHTDFDITIKEIDRCIPRMQKLGVSHARVMSYAQEPWGDDQFDKERFKRLKYITARFKDAGLQALHENCMNWGGFSADHTMRLLDEVPDLKLVFDTGNPIFQRDRSKPSSNSANEESYPWQDALEFYHRVKHAITHVHVKDAIIENDKPRYTFAGEGHGHVKVILKDLLDSGFQCMIAIEPHMGKVFHDSSQDTDPQKAYDIYLEYGRRFESLINALND